MVHHLDADLIAAIEAYVNHHPGESFAAVSKAIQEELRRLSECGLLSLGNDKDLTGDSLEIRVFLLFQAMGIQIARGRDGFEDFIATPPEEAIPNLPLVIEVKSDRKPSIKRDELRQLDDWVFDLSQEEMARKHGLGGSGDSIAMLTGGFITEKQHHPTPHKGVLVFNAPVGQPFELRISLQLTSVEMAFIQKRNFCIIPINTLIRVVESMQQENDTLLAIWREIHETCGVFRSSQP